jgi:hypothetical protein
MAHKEDEMRGHGLAIAAAAALMLSASGALAASGSERDCDLVGGTYIKDGPNSICVEPETTKDVNGNAFGTTTQNTTTGQGNTGNKTQEECTGNQGQCKQQ